MSENTGLLSRLLGKCKCDGDGTGTLSKFSKKEVTLLLINILRTENGELRRYVKWLLVALIGENCALLGIEIGWLPSPF